jgi:hypothetical protein
VIPDGHTISITYGTVTDEQGVTPDVAMYVEVRNSAMGEYLSAAIRNPDLVGWDIQDPFPDWAYDWCVANLDEHIVP